MAENFDIFGFDLSDEEMSQIAALDTEHGALERLLPVPSIVSGQLERILDRRTQLAAGAPSSQALSPAAVNSLAELNRARTTRNLRTTLGIAHAALFPSLRAAFQRYHRLLGRQRRWRTRQRHDQKQLNASRGQWDHYRSRSHSRRVPHLRAAVLQEPRLLGRKPLRRTRQRNHDEQLNARRRKRDHHRGRHYRRYIPHMRPVGRWHCQVLGRKRIWTARQWHDDEQHNAHGSE